MYLDGEEERMLRAIVHSAVVAAATGHPFSGEFHRFAVNASCSESASANNCTKRTIARVSRSQ
ncbi:MAG: hypothetical protein IPI27_02840 [Betaproteobacteria bacterium]|nr:hypothetical protein [Betaproteobacteria bacterium]